MPLKSKLLNYFISIPLEMFAQDHAEHLATISYFLLCCIVLRIFFFIESNYNVWVKNDNTSTFDQIILPLYTSTLKWFGLIEELDSYCS